jgi:Family of unknown function (DUF6350)
MSGTPGERTTDHPDAATPRTDAGRVDAGRGERASGGSGRAGGGWRSVVPGASSPDDDPGELLDDFEDIAAPSGEADWEAPDDGREPDWDDDSGERAGDAAGGDTDERAGGAGPAGDDPDGGEWASEEEPDGDAGGAAGAPADGARGGGEPRIPGTRVPPDGRPPRPRPGGPRAGRAPVLIAATATTVLGALLVWVPVVLVVLLVATPGPGGPGAAGTVRASLALWLLGHGVPEYVSGARLSVAPLGLSLLAAWRVARAGVHTARAIGARRRRPVLPVVQSALSVAGIYALLGALAGELTGSGGLHTGPLAAGVRLGVFGLLFGGFGAAMEARLPSRVLRRAPELLRDALRTGLVGGALVLAAGAGVGGIALATHAGDATDVLRAYNAGVPGQAGLTLVSLGYAPNLVSWAAAYLVGPGFGIGAGTWISAASVTLGPLPALPVLAGLPRTAASGFGVLLLGLPVAAGMVAGGLLARRRLRGPDAPPLRWGALVGAATLAGPVAGLLLGLAALVSGGDLGSDQLTNLGPVAWQVALIGSAVVAVGSVLGAAATAVAIGSRQQHRPRPARRVRPTRPTGRR